MGVAIKFAVGGLVAVLVGAVAQRLGGRAGGLLAGFPGVFWSSVALMGQNPSLSRLVLASLAAVSSDVALVYLSPRLMRAGRGWLTVFSLLGVWLATALPLGWLASRVAV